jgi:hypothetical protein
MNIICLALADKSIYQNLEEIRSQKIIDHFD